MVKKIPRILCCPLDWGIGHATRIIPVIRHLLQQRFDVVIAADGRSLDFLKEYFPDLECIRLPGFRVSYPAGKNMAMKMAVQAPAFLSGIFREHQRLKKIIGDYQIDAVISDNRFGIWSKKTYSVYMTHQLMIKAPETMKWAEPWLHRAHQWFIRHYDECWVPDIPGEKNLSGDLSHMYPLPSNGHYIGFLSRFDAGIRLNQPEQDKNGPELLVLLSGPEPQRTLFEGIILKELAENTQQNTVILRGLPDKYDQNSPQPGVISYNHLPDEEISRLIRNAGVIICRPGYSTIMDLVTLGRNAILVPTPGQTEQEYLAKYLSADGLFYEMEQEGFNLRLALQAGRMLPKSNDFQNDRSLLESGINNLRGRLKSRDTLFFFVAPTGESVG